MKTLDEIKEDIKDIPGDITRYFRWLFERIVWCWMWARFSWGTYPWDDGYIWAYLFKYLEQLELALLDGNTVSGPRHSKDVRKAKLVAKRLWEENYMRMWTIQDPDTDRFDFNNHDWVTRRFGKLKILTDKEFKDEGEEQERRRTRDMDYLFHLLKHKSRNWWD